MRKNMFIILGMMTLLTGNLAAQKKSTLPVEIQKLYSQMVLIEGGNYNLHQEWIDNYKEDGIATTVKTFYAQKYEVNRELWFYVMGKKNDWWEKEDDGSIDMTKPANGVSWEEAILFCNKLSKKAGLTQCYDITNIKDVVFDENVFPFKSPSVSSMRSAFSSSNQNVTPSSSLRTPYC